MSASASSFRASLLLGAAALLLSGCEMQLDAEGYTAREQKTFKVSGTPELTLATFDGAIEVRAWDRPEVQVVIERRGESREEAESIEVVSEQSGNRISVEARRPAGGRRLIVIGHHVGRSAKLTASVPRQTNLLARSSDGSIGAWSVDGRIELRTDDGAVRGEDLRGQVRVQTGDGSVRISRLEGSLNLDTDDGSVNVDGKLAAVHARSGDGSVEVRASPGSVMTDDWDITTGDGAVQLDLPEGFNAEIDARTRDGRVRVTDLPLTVRGEVVRDAVQARLGSGGRQLKVRSGDGSIRLRRAGAQLDPTPALEKP
jgi:Toastrack DUF4097